MDGLTGDVRFDQQGLRSGFRLDIIELKKSGLNKVNKMCKTTNPPPSCRSRLLLKLHPFSRSGRLLSIATLWPLI